MKLLKSITVLVILFCTTFSSAQRGKWKTIKGDGNIITTTISTESYDGLKAAGPMDFKLIPGNEGEISIKADANLLEYIEVFVKRKQLYVKVKDGYNLKSRKTISITVPYETLNAIALAGSGDIKNSGTITAEHLKISVAGSGDIDLAINAQSVESIITGSGEIELQGFTKDLSVKVTGSGDFDGKDLKSTHVTSEITGSGSASVVCNGELKVRITGSGDLKYYGNPTNKDTKVTGSGSIRN